MRVLSLTLFCIVLLFEISLGQTCTINTTQTNINCNGASTGLASVSVNGGGGGGANNCVSPQLPGSSDNCTSGCTSTITSNANVTVASGQKICITANNYSGQIQLNGGTAVLCGTGNAPSIIFNGGALVITGSTTLSTISNWSSGSSSITNYGTLTLNSASTLEVGFNNHGTANINGGLTMGYTSSGFVNTGVLNISSGNLTFRNNGTALNNNTINITSGTLLVDWGKTFTTNCTLTLGGAITNHGTFLNTGNITSSGLTSDGGSFNNNSKINISGLTSFTGGTIGIASGSEIITSNFILSVSVNGSGSSCASIKTSGNTTFNWGAAFTGQARYCDLNGVIETNLPNLTANISLTTCSCNVNTPVCTYSWKNSSNVVIATTQNVTNLPAGIYTVTATCSGCTNSPLTSSVTLTQPSALSFTFSKADVNCNGNTNGSITINATGGTGTIQYSKDNGATYQAGNVFSGLAAGTYPIVVRDANNCLSAVQNISIGAPLSITAVISKTDITCSGNNNGTISVTASGGTGTIQYSKDNGVTYQTGNAFSGLSAGTYPIIVKDGNNCSSAVQNINIIAPSNINVTVAKTNEACNGSNDGTITVSANGGTGTLQYSKDNGLNYQTSNVFTGLSSGTYLIIVRDVNNCASASQSIVIDQTSSFTITTSKTDVTCYGLSNGTANISVLGNGSQGANNCVTTAPQDCSNGCTTTYSSNTGNIVLNNASEKICLTATNYTGNINLNAGGTLVICGNANPSSISLNNGAKVIITGTGSLTVNGLSVNNPCTLENYGIVTVNGNMTNNHVVINGKTLIVTGDFSDNGGSVLTNFCTMSVGGNLNNNGTIINKGKFTATNISTVNGGAVIAMDNGSELITNSLILNGSIQGPANGTCSSIQVSGITSINGGAVITGQVSLCDANGIETNNAVGLSSFLNCNCNLATPNCSYSWKNSLGTEIGTSATINNLVAGTYTVTATCGGCTNVPSNVIISEPTQLSISMSGTVNCSLTGTGTANALVTGGTAPYTYLWSPGNNTSSGITGLIAGTYSVVVSDANGCTSNGSYLVLASSPIIISYTRSGTSINTSVAGGVGPYTFLWDTPTNQTSQNQTNLPYGTYSVTVTDINGCFATLSIVLNPPIIQIDTKSVDPTSLNVIGVTSPSNPYMSGLTGGPLNDGIIPVTPILPGSGGSNIIILEILQGNKNVPMKISFSIDENANISLVKADVKNNNTFTQMVSDYYQIDNSDDNVKKIKFFKYNPEPIQTNFTTNLLNGLVLDQVSDPLNKFTISNLGSLSVVSLNIYNTTGQLIKTVSIPEWDGTDNSSVGVVKGTYKFELNVSDLSATTYTYKGQLILKK